MKNLCCEIIPGHDFLQQHSQIEIPFGGSMPTLKICGLVIAKIQYPSLFKNLTENCKPIAVRSRRFSYNNKKFIDSEIKRLLEEGIIEPSKSPWRAQVVITTSKNHKKRMFIGYSQTINRFTLLNAFSLARIDKMIGEIAKYQMLSTLDLKSKRSTISILQDSLWHYEWGSQLPKDSQPNHNG